MHLVTQEMQAPAERADNIFLTSFYVKFFFNKRKEAIGLMYYQGSLICLLEGQDELKTHASLFS